MVISNEHTKLHKIYKEVPLWPNINQKSYTKLELLVRKSKLNIKDFIISEKNKVRSTLLKEDDLKLNEDKKRFQYYFYN